MSTLIKYISTQTDVKNIDHYDESFVNNIIEQRTAILKLKDIETYSNFLINSKAEQLFFFKALNNNYSEFYRNPFTFYSIENLLFPLFVGQLLNKNKKEIRVWSAASSAGQEAYSLAILFEEYQMKCADLFPYRIFATDKCSEEINKAKTGMYKEVEFLQMSFSRIKKWFSKKGDNYFIDPNLQKNIHFSVFDLLNKSTHSPGSSIYGDFDLIICANILFYYKPMYQMMIIEKLVGNLSKGGYLVVSEIERHLLLENNYKEIYPQSGIFQPKY